MNVYVWIQNQLTTDDMPAKASGFLARHFKVRFLTFTNTDGQQHLILSVGGYNNQSHVEIVGRLGDMQPTWTFVSGGYATPTGVLCFDSESCCLDESIGFDRPKTKPEQTALLETIREALRTHGILQ